MKNIRIFTCKWDYLPYPASRTFQLGPLIITRHFPGYSSWSLEISTQRGLAIFPAFYAIGDRFVEMAWHRALRSRWRSITLRIGKPIFTLHLNRESLSRYIGSLEKATIHKATAS